jgi:non-heme Fe2+,alpha-ketoglutarate-dependent halogenase
MSNALDQAAISQFRRDGFHYPHAGISAVRAQAARADLEAHEAASGGRLTALSPSSRYKLHVKLPWAYAVASDPAILDAIESLIGPDILIFTSTMFVKEPQTDAVTLWHQDAAYFGLRPHEHVTAWVALSEASETAGCMTFLTHHGAHHKAQNGPLRDAPRLLRHKTKAQANSINGAGQSIVDVFDDRSGVRATLRVGEFSLHHTLCVHSSPPNASNDRRIGLGISYIPARVQHIGSVRQRAMLVRGQDSFGHFDLEPPPGTNTNENKAAYELSLQRYNKGYAEQMDWHEAGRLHADSPASGD